MTFELLPTATPWIIGFIVLAVLGAAVSLATVAASLPRNRRARVARHESVRTYYGRLVLGH